MFEPRSATSRRRIFQQDYIKALQQAEVAIVAKPYDQSKIAEEDRFSTEELVEAIKAHGKSAYEGDNVDHIIELLTSQAQPGDVILIMSNGGFDGIYGKLLNALG